MSGRLFGLGVGPGDPDLITLKALSRLRAAPVVAYPAPEEGASFARAIVARWLTPAQTEFVICVPMAAERFPAQAVYDRAAEAIGEHLDAGRDVAVLCQGDPFFYGSFMYLFGRLAGRFAVEIVPGVSSLGACAAAAQWPLAARSDVLTVVPASLPEADIAERLAATDAAAIIKVGRHLAKICAVLDRLGLAEDARYVEHASLVDQRVLPITAARGVDAPYFSMILVHRRGEAWR